MEKLACPPQGGRRERLGRSCRADMWLSAPEASIQKGSLPPRGRRPTKVVDGGHVPLFCRGGRSRAVVTAMGVSLTLSTPAVQQNERTILATTQSTPRVEQDGLNGVSCGTTQPQPFPCFGISYRVKKEHVASWLSYNHLFHSHCIVSSAHPFRMHTLHWL